MCFCVHNQIVAVQQGVTMFVLFHSFRPHLLARAFLHSTEILFFSKYRRYKSLMALPSLFCLILNFVCVKLTRKMANFSLHSHSVPLSSPHFIILLFQIKQENCWKMLVYRRQSNNIWCRWIFSGNDSKRAHFHHICNGMHVLTHALSIHNLTHTHNHNHFLHPKDIFPSERQPVKFNRLH